MSPVAGQLTKRREPHDLAIRADASAIQSGPTNDGYAPAALRARAEHRESVVADDGSLGPAANAKPRGDPSIVDRDVRAGDAVNGRPGDGFAIRVDARVSACRLDRLLQRIVRS